MVLRIVVGLVLTAVAFAVAGRRLWWLKRLALSGQPAPDRIEAARAHLGRDLETQATEVIGQRKLLKWSVPGAAHAATFWGFIVLLLTIIEAYGDLFSRTFAIPGIGHWAVIGFIEDLFAVGVLAGIITFTVIRLREQPAQGRPQVTLLRLPHRRRLGRPGHDLPGHRHPAAVPRRPDQHRRVPLRPRRLRQPDRRPLAPPAGLRGQQRARGGLHPGPDRRDHGLRRHRGLLQAPAHRAGPGEHPVLPAPERPGRPGADAQQRQGAGLRGGRPGHRRVRPGQDRGLHLEGPAGHGHLHRVRAVPVAVPGLGHRQAAVAQAGHPGPARPRLRQGPVPAGRLRRGTREAAGSRQGTRPNARWSARTAASSTPT